MTTKALIVVDAQKDFCEGGSLAVTGGNKVAERVAEKISSLASDTLLVFTKDFHVPNDSNGGHIALPPESPDFIDTWPAHCVQGTEGADLNDYLKDFNAYRDTFYKGMGVPAYSGFEGIWNAETDAEGGWTLADFLRSYKVADIDVCGIAADYCVKATMLDARRYGFNVNLLTDLTVGIHKSGEEVAKEFATGDFTAH